LNINDNGNNNNLNFGNYFPL